MKHDCKRACIIVILAIFAIGLISCKKEKIDVPTVKVFEGAITIDITKASVSAEVTNQGGAEVKLRGFVYGLSGGNLDTVFCGSGTGVYSAELNNLQPNTTYVYEAFAKNMGGLGTSGKVSFTTKPMPFFTIDVSANPSDGGRVSGGGSFQQGQYCTVMALANESYTFTNWTENDNDVSTDANYTFMVNGDRTLKANFTAQSFNEFTISVSANPNDGGEVSGGGIYQEGQSCTVSATANDGYSFTNWTENGSEVSTDANYTFNVNNSRTLVANFTILPPSSYAISVSANPSNGGTVSGGGTYQHGQQCTLTATENDGYTFTNWTENGQVIPDAGASYTFTVTSNRTLVANFATQQPNVYSINVSANPVEGGTVTGGGTYQQGQECTVTAWPNEGYGFINWTENGIEVSSRTSYTFPVNSNRTLVANFTTQQPNVYTINASANLVEGGTVTGGGIYEQGQQCVVEATPNQGYTFINWSENGNVISTSNRFTFIVSCNRSLEAIFKPVAPNNICANAYPICVEEGYEYPAGVNAGNGEAGPEYGCLSTRKNPAWYFFRLNEPGDMDISIYSSRNPDIDFCCWGPFTDPISPCPNGLTENKIVSCSYSTSDIEHCIIPATAQAGEYYIIVITNYSNQPCGIHFSKVGGSGTSDCSFIVEPPSPNYYSISVSSNPTNGGTVSGGGTYQQGQSCTVSAVVNNGYVFVNWTENGNFVSADADYTFTVNADHDFVANFVVQPQAPIGAINGLFTINGIGDKAFFSRGNLQYKASNNTWRFATNQYDCIGEANTNISSTYSGWIDLFGWGTSGWNCGNTYYRPWDSNNSNGSLYGPPGEYNLMGSYANSDWGYYNAISNGGNQTHQWRTLTQSEWNYVFNQRNTTSGKRYAKAQVNGVNGVILLPDDWSTSYYSLNNYNSNGTSYTNNVISSSNWTNYLEAHGAVFLPAAGYRSGTSVDSVASSGFYWSASYFNSGYACGVYFYDSYLDLYNGKCRYSGRSVRLVCPAE